MGSNTFRLPVILANPNSSTCPSRLILAGSSLEVSMVEILPLSCTILVPKGKGRDRSEKSIELSLIRMPPMISPRGWPVVPALFSGCSIISLERLVSLFSSSPNLPNSFSKVSWEKLRLLLPGSNSKRSISRELQPRRSEPSCWF